jgi:hypothetical protein
MQAKRAEIPLEFPRRPAPLQDPICLPVPPCANRGLEAARARYSLASSGLQNGHAIGLPNEPRLTGGARAVVRALRERCRRCDEILYEIRIDTMSPQQLSIVDALLRKPLSIRRTESAQL